MFVENDGRIFEEFNKRFQEQFAIHKDVPEIRQLVLNQAAPDELKIT